MPFVLTIETENAAFGDDGCGAAMEVARILDDVADRLRGMEYEGTCCDTNGNTVGRFDWKEG